MRQQKGHRWCESVRASLLHTYTTLKGRHNKTRNYQKSKFVMLLKIFVGCFLFSVSAIALLLFLTSKFSTTGPGINNSDRKTGVIKSTRHLQVPPQQLVDLKSFQFTINNDICGQQAITIVQRVVFLKKKKTCCKTISEQVSQCKE